VLARMAALAGVRPVDTYGILKAFGRDCAGAIMVLPAGESPFGGGGYTPMTPGELRRLIGTLDVVPLGAAPERGFRPKCWAASPPRRNSPPNLTCRPQKRPGHREYQARTETGNANR